MTNTVSQTDSSSPTKAPHKRRSMIIVIIIAAVVGIGLAILAAIFGPQLLGFQATDQEAEGGNPPPAAPQAEGLTEFRDEQVGIALSYPSSWDKLPPRDPGEVRLILRAKNGPQEAFMVLLARELPTPVGQPEIDAAVKEAAARIEGGNNADVLATQPITLGGLPGHWFLYSMLDPASNQLQTHSHFVLFKQNTVINLLYRTTPGESFEEFAPVFDRINSSFRVLEQ